MRKILCFSGGKDSTAMLIHIIENNMRLDDIIYVDMGSWMWSSAKEHIKQVEEVFNVKINIIHAEEEIWKGFERWGFPSFVNRWCTGVKKELMRKYIKENYDLGEKIVQYIGYCADEDCRINKKLYHSFSVEYPLVDAGISTDEALNLCKEYGFDFGGNYEHHSHYNCWLCPLQRVNELRYLWREEPELWNRLRQMQYRTDGEYQYKRTIFDFDKKFWLEEKEKLRENREIAKRKYNRRKKS